MTRDEHERRVAALKRRYPYLFAGDHLGHDIPPGWLVIIEELCAQIDAALAEAEKPAARFTQIKEKFGGLRAYLSGAPLRVDIIRDRGAPVSGHARAPASSALFARLAPLVRQAEERSFQTCLFCGAPGKLRGDRLWLLTLCDMHEPYGYRDLDDRFEELTTP
ncbi:MAG TPA: hypothetical protein VHE11_15495 [Steroidobacteraceae bacterium]|nr:hypothetical protein [Steroidobacteraceae bacterium]